MILRFFIIIVLVLLVMTATKKLILGFYRRKLLRIVEERFAGRRIILMALDANYFGLKTKGGRQVRGNGALVLTDDELWFCLAAPTREITIPISAINRAELKRGRTIFRQLVMVEFTYQGNSEQIAWSVNDPLKWKNAIAGMIR